MEATILVVPGLHGSDPGHWQSWLEQQLPAARRVQGIDWDRPVLSDWAAAIGAEIDLEFEQSDHKVWLVAHSFGCLAVIVAAARRWRMVAGVMLVAPADPELFTVAGLRQDDDDRDGLGNHLPQGRLAFPILIVSSGNDRWLSPARAQYWAWLWKAEWLPLGDVGHINAESGFGPWPEGLRLLRALQQDRHRSLRLGHWRGNTSSLKISL